MKNWILSKLDAVLGRKEGNKTTNEESEVYRKDEHLFPQNESYTLQDDDTLNEKTQSVHPEIPAKPVAVEYIDLGLSSGTKWCNVNVEGYYSYADAVEQFGENLPSKEQWQELTRECQWSWTGDGYIVTGPNGNSIALSLEGWRLVIMDKIKDYFVGAHGRYWSSTPSDLTHAWSTRFASGGVWKNLYEEESGSPDKLDVRQLSVRLVKK